MLADSLPLAEMCSFVEWIVTNDEWIWSSTAELWMQYGWRSRTTLELYELYKWTSICRHVNKEVLLLNERAFLDVIEEKMTMVYPNLMQIV